MSTVDQIETAGVDAASYLENGKINYREKIQRRNNAQAELAVAQQRLTDLESRIASGDPRVTGQMRREAANNVEDLELVLKGCETQVELAIEAINGLDDSVARFAADVIGLHAAEFKLSDAAIVLSKFKPTEEPDTKTLVIAQHEPGDLGGGGLMDGSVKAWGYGGASLDGDAVRKVFAQYSWLGERGVEFGNYPAYALTFKSVHFPVPEVSHPGADALAQMLVNHAKLLNQRPFSYDAVTLWAQKGDREFFAAEAEGEDVSVKGAIAVGCHQIAVEGYTPGALADKVTSHMATAYKGRFVPGIGIVTGVEVTGNQLAAPNGVLMHFTAKGRRKAPGLAGD